MLKIDIEKALSLQTCKLAMRNYKNQYCAWGGAIAAIEGVEIKAGTSIPMFLDEFSQNIVETARELERSLSPLDDIMGRNDRSTTEEQRQIERRKAVQLLLQTGLVEPMDKDLELSRELLKEVKTEVTV